MVTIKLVINFHDIFFRLIDDDDDDEGDDDDGTLRGEII